MAIANAGWLISARLFNDALSLVLFGFIAHQYGPAGLGVYSTYFAIATVLYDLVALGIDDYGVRQYAISSEDERPSLLQHLMRLQLGVAGTCAVAVGTFAVIAKLSPSDLLVLASLCIFQLSNALGRTLNIPRLVRGSIAVLSIADVLSRVGIAIFALIAAYALGGDLTMALLGFPIFGTAYLLFVIWLERRRLPGRGLFRWTGREWPLLRSLAPFALFHALNSVIVRVPMLALFFLVSDVAAGLYSTAFKMTELGWAVLSYFVLASYAALTRAAKGGVDRLATDAEHLLRQMLMLGGLLAWGLFTVAPLLVVPLLGSKVADARILIAIMSPYLLLLSMSLFVGQLLYVYGRPSQRLKAQASKAVVTILLCLLATPRYGAVGAIVALLASELLGLLLQCAMLAPHLKTRFLLRRILQFSAAVLLGVGTGWTVAWLVDMPLAGCAVALAVFLVTAVSSRLLSREILGNLSHSH